MGTFQITYDDFTGGHYMGDRVNNQPSNTWKGQDVVLTSRGDLMPVAYGLAVSYAAQTTSLSDYGVLDAWLVGANIYVFAQWDGSSKVGKMYVESLDTVGGSSSNKTLSDRPAGRVAYDATNSCFYYAGRVNGTIYKITTGKSESTFSSALTGLSIDSLTISGYRIFAWNTSGTKLYYSDAARTSFATTDYYEFPGNIQAVYSRTNDILVITSEGTYSMVGVPGSSVTIQRILPGSDTKEGMNRGAIVGRSLIFTDSSLTGQIDGNLYELTGATVRQIASFDSTVVLDNLNSYPENSIVQNIGNGCVATMFANGKVYVTSPNNTWNLLTCGAATSIKANRMAISQAGNATRNEFFGVATMSSTGQLDIYRVPYHFPVPVKYDYKFDSTSNTNSTTNLPTGYATLAEYWHNKPCVVKEVIAEWVIDDKAKTYITGLIGVGATVTPLGCVDVTPANVPSLTTSTASDSVTGSTLSTGYPIRVISRFRIDGANKGYGFSVQMTLNSCRLRRAVVVCED